MAQSGRSVSLYEGLLRFDGGMLVKNPGEAAGAAVIWVDGEVVAKVGKRIGFATNNQAEYWGLLVGLAKARDIGLKEIAIQGDSRLVVMQVQGFWGCSHAHLNVLRIEARKLLKGFKRWSIEWVPRKENADADSACRQLLGKK